MRYSFLLLTILAMLTPYYAAAQGKQMYSIPSRQQMKWACEVTKGKWQTLPKYCKDMHPAALKELKEKERSKCYEYFNEPCECGVARRFSIQPKLGCVESPFEEDVWH